MQHKMLNYNYRIMKKRGFLLALSLVFSLVLSAQSIKQIDGKKIYYIQIGLYSNGKNKDVAAVNYGYTQTKNNKFEYEFLKDSNGDLLHFYDKLSIVNYMTLQGWTYMDSTDGLLRGSEFATFAKEVTDAEAKELMSKMTHKELNK